MNSPAPTYATTRTTRDLGVRQGWSAGERMSQLSPAASTSSSGTRSSGTRTRRRITAVPVTHRVLGVQSDVDRTKGHQMKADEIFTTAKDALTVRRVYADPVERDGITVITGAALRGGAGGGGGHDKEGSEGTGGGFGVGAKPAGA